jgi:dihydrolipoamide dehydrogenase
VTILERSATLLCREEPRVGDLIAARLRADGVDVRTRMQATGARRDGADSVVTLDDGTEARCDVVVVGAGRKPRTAGLGLERVGVRLGEKGEIPVDEHCRASDRVWAIGD